jgi:hypothetical protein
LGSWERIQRKLTGLVIEALFKFDDHTGAEFFQRQQEASIEEERRLSEKG